MFLVPDDGLMKSETSRINLSFGKNLFAVDDFKWVSDLGLNMLLIYETLLKTCPFIPLLAKGFD